MHFFAFESPSPISMLPGACQLKHHLPLGMGPSCTTVPLMFLVYHYWSKIARSQIAVLSVIKVSIGSFPVLLDFVNFSQTFS